MKEFADEVAEGRRLIFRSSAVGSHASLGGGEVAVQIVVGLVRSNKLALEGRLKQKLEPTSAIVQHLPQYVAWCYNRFQPTRADQRTPYERLTLRKYDGAVATFGEKVLLKAKVDCKMQAKWLTAFWTGRSMTNDSHMGLHVSEGVVASRSVRRSVASEAWGEERSDKQEPAPHRVYAADKKSQGEEGREHREPAETTG